MSRISDRAIAISISAIAVVAYLAAGFGLLTDYDYYGRLAQAIDSGRWWLEEHAKYDDEHPIHALEIIKDCVKRGNGDTPEKVTKCALESLSLMKVSMEASYHA